MFARLQPNKRHLSACQQLQGHASQMWLDRKIMALRGSPVCLGDELPLPCICVCILICTFTAFPQRLEPLSICLISIGSYYDDRCPAYTASSVSDATMVWTTILRLILSVFTHWFSRVEPCHHNAQCFSLFKVFFLHHAYISKLLFYRSLNTDRISVCRRYSLSKHVTALT